MVKRLYVKIKGKRRLQWSRLPSKTKAFSKQVKVKKPSTNAIPLKVLYLKRKNKNTTQQHINF